jgi:hypothetical protein
MMAVLQDFVQTETQFKNPRIGECSRVYRYPTNCQKQEITLISSFMYVLVLEERTALIDSCSLQRPINLDPVIEEGFYEKI